MERERAIFFFFHFSKYSFRKIGWSISYREAAMQQNIQPNVGNNEMHVEKVIK